MNKKKSSFIREAVSFSTPTLLFLGYGGIVHAALSAPLAKLLDTLIVIANAVIAFLFGLALVIFLWGVYKYISSASTEGKEGARVTIIYGIIGLFVMLSVWGLVKILTETFALTNTAPTSVELPTFTR